MPGVSSEGSKRAEIEVFKSSNPIRRIKKLMIRPAMYSILPCPKGWDSSGFVEESLKPSSWTMELAASDRLLKASAVRAMLFERVPATNFTANKRTLKKIPAAPQSMP